MAAIPQIAYHYLKSKCELSFRSLIQVHGSRKNLVGVSNRFTFSSFPHPLHFIFLVSSTSFRYQAITFRYFGQSLKVRLL